jgi:hypothetical protein
MPLATAMISGDAPYRFTQKSLYFRDDTTFGNLYAPIVRLVGHVLAQMMWPARIVPETPGQNRDRGQQGFEVAWRQIDDQAEFGELTRTQ